MAQPLVSVIVTTRNNEATLEACLSSLRTQTYPAIELIVVDNGSTDATKTIAARYTKNVKDHGPERSAQRNYAVSIATGQYVLIIDSDMEVGLEVVAACVNAVDAKHQAVIIPEESFGEGFWAQTKVLERSFYNGVDWIEAPRFFDATLYRELGGYDENMSGGEDWDLTARVRERTDVARVKPVIRHNEGHPTLKSIVGKRRYYAKGFSQYYEQKPKTQMRGGVAQVLGVYGLFLSQPTRLFRKPIIGLGMLYMKTAEFGAICLTLIKGKIPGKSETVEHN